MVSALRFVAALGVTAVGVIVFPVALQVVFGFIGGAAAAAGVPITAAGTAVQAGVFSFVGGVLLALYAGYRVVENA